jgi:magnesium transporter
MIGNLLQPELVELIRQRNFTQLREILCDFSAPEIAEIFTDLKADDEAVLLRILPHEVATKVFEYLSHEDQEQLLHALGNEQVAQILNDLSPDDRTVLLEELPAAATQKLLSLLSPDERKIAADLLGYPKNSIGRRMTPEYVAIQENWTAADVLAHLRKVGRERESLNQLYVVDDKGRLVDSVRLRNLVVRDLHTPLTELLDQQRLFLRATDGQEVAVRMFKKYDRTILPVLDSKDTLVGVVTVDDVLDMAERAATEDIQKLGGMEALDAPYLKIGMLEMIRKRAPWLIILFVSEMLTTTAMGFFEEEISKAVVLALFLPLIISSGGNSGSQATTLIIRAMALGEVTLGFWWRVMRREVVSGLLLGLILGTIGMLRITLWHIVFHAYGPHWPLIGLTIFFSLIGVVMWGTLSGSMLPFLLKRLGLDPAASSAPFVATLVDVTGLVIYFMVALQVLSGSLLAPPPAGIVRLDYKPTPDAFQRLLNLNDNWEVGDISLNTNTGAVRIEVRESANFVKNVKSPECNGKLEVYDHLQPKVWSYPDLLGYHTEIESRLPMLRCKDGKVITNFPEVLPWEGKGKLLPAGSPGA